jgi:hypothetical protein
MYVSPVEQFSRYVLENLKHFFMFHEILKYITYVAKKNLLMLSFFVISASN